MSNKKTILCEPPIKANTKLVCPGCALPWAITRAVLQDGMCLTGNLFSFIGPKEYQDGDKLECAECTASLFNYRYIPYTEGIKQCECLIQDLMIAGCQCGGK